jgi:hypothetical protein
MKKVASRAKVALAYASLILTYGNVTQVGSSAHSAHFVWSALVMFEQQAMLQHGTSRGMRQYYYLNSLLGHSENNAELVDKIQISVRL